MATQLEEAVQAYRIAITCLTCNGNTYIGTRRQFGIQGEANAGSFEDGRVCSTCDGSGMAPTTQPPRYA